MFARLVVVCCGLFLAVSAVPRCAEAQGDAWVGREFMPRQQCSPKVGKQVIPWERISLPFKVQKVQGEWLWIGQAWVRKQDVIALPQPIEEFQIARNGDWPIVPVTIDGHEYQFVVDTGCTNIVVDKSLEHKLVPIPSFNLVKEISDDFDEHRLVGGTVGQSELVVTGPAGCRDLQPFRMWSGHDIRGILGMSFLKGKIVRFDFDEGKLTILRSFPAPPANTFPLAYNRGKIPILDFEFSANQATAFKLDTGWRGDDCGHFEPTLFEELTRDGHLTLTGETGRAFSFYGVQTLRHAKLKQFRLGRFHNNNLGFVSGRSNFLGLGYLSRFVVTFDFQNDRVHFQKGSHFDKKARENKFGAILYRAGGDTIADKVFPESPAGVAGLRAGDRILTIDGRDCAELSLFELADLFATAGAHLRLVVLDVSGPRAVEVVLADWRASQTALKKTDQVSE
jgi:PDZ domain/Aspartyl protease